MAEPKKILVIGGSAAGPKAAAKARRMDQPIDEVSCQMLADFLTIFSSPPRLRIFCLLQNREQKTVSELADALGMSLQNASRHLRLMRDKGAVVSRKEGQNVYYWIANQRIIDAMTQIRHALVADLQEKINRVHP